MTKLKRGDVLIAVRDGSMFNSNWSVVTIHKYKSYVVDIIQEYGDHYIFTIIDTKYGDQQFSDEYLDKDSQLYLFDTLIEQRVDKIKSLKNE